MKTKILPLCAVLALTVLFSCKKNETKEIARVSVADQEQDTIPASQLNMNDINFSQLAAAGSYKVIAGKYNVSAQVDGNGSNARFSEPSGIFVNTDGSLLVADLGGDIRKIQHDTVVTSIHFPEDPDGFSYFGGNDIAATTDGSIMVVGEHEYWLYTNGVPHYHGVDSHNEIGLGVDRDPSGKFFWYSDFTSLRAVKPNGEDIPTQPLYAEIGGFNALSASNNGVKYFASNSQVYKYTKSGVSAQIFKNFTFSNIGSLTSTRDGFKVYIVDAGEIKLISNNSKYPQTIKTILSGAQVGSIALSNSEKYLYFTAHNTVNKLKL
ncbi:hypothetical protein [Mucilaginibacter phyllosphaerae]